MALEVTITDSERPIWIGSYDEFEHANKEALTADEFATLFDYGEIDIGGGAAPLLHVTLWETDHATD